jgi:methyltransferase-like protein
MKLEDIPVEKRKSFESVYNSFLNTIKEIQKWTEKLSETLSKPLSIEEIIKNTDLKLRGILSSEE